MLTPKDILAKASAYVGQGNGSVRAWIQATMVGLGVPAYSGYLLSSGNSSSIEQFLQEMCSATGQELTVVAMASNKLTNFKPDIVRQVCDSIYILGNRGFFYVMGAPGHSFSCAFELLHYDLTDAERKAVLNFQERELKNQNPESMQNIFMLVDYGAGDFNFHSNKIHISDLKVENYTAENVAWMDKLKNSLFSPTATGRLTIFQGPAGTGKTRYLRAMMRELGENVVPIVLPVSLAAELSHPRMLGQITANDGFDDKNLLLIIEDGDSLLERRDRSSSVISDFLNIVDGLIGEIVNLHIIVTTNLQKNDFDPAITRAGRLHSILYFEALQYEQAAKVYKRETGDELVKDKDEYTLAEVYTLINNHGNGIRNRKLSDAGQYL